MILLNRKSRRSTIKTNAITGNMINSAPVCSTSSLLASTLLFVIDVALMVVAAYFVVVSGFQWQQRSHINWL